MIQLALTKGILNLNSVLYFQVPPPLEAPGVQVDTLTLLSMTVVLNY